jgi:Ohr subfamily peroxiredoxin
MLIEEALCRAHVKATAGRDTRVVSSDGALDLKVSMPRELGGTNGRGTNPEQLFAAAYTSSFPGIVRLVAAREGFVLPADAEIDASVAVGATPRGFGIEVELRVCLPGLPRAEADALVEKAHTLCPYSNATRDNIAVRTVFA